MITEIKKWLAVKLLNWSFSIMPECKFKTELAKLISTELLNGME